MGSKHLLSPGGSPCMGGDDNGLPKTKLVLDWVESLGRTKLGKHEGV